MQAPTKNLFLNQWELTDKPRMEEFNADNRIIDAAVQQLHEKKINADGSTPMTGALQAPNVQIVNDSNTSQIVFKNKSGKEFSRIINAALSNSILMRAFANDETYSDLWLDGNSRAVYGNPNGQLDLGMANRRWKDGYFVNAPTVGSDRRIKKDISSLEVSLLTKLLLAIPAVKYRLIDGESGRFHYGFIAQDVEAALSETGLTNMDFAGLIKSPALDENGNETGDYIYALRLEEFIPILWAHQQDVERRLQKAGI